MGWGPDIPALLAGAEERKAAEAAAAEATAKAQAATAAAEAQKAANQAQWNLNHPVRNSFAGDTIMTLGTQSQKAKKILLGE